MKTDNTIITIDPGKGGGIAVYSKGKVTAFKMPPDIFEMAKQMIYFNETYDNIVVFIEKVQSFGVGDNEGGKNFRINIMLSNYTEVLTMVKLSGFRFVEVAAISWQGTLGLRKKNDKRSYEQRKRDYKTYAQNCFPEIKVTLQISDALCLVQFALTKISIDMKWIRSKLQNENAENYFKKILW